MTETNIATGSPPRRRAITMFVTCGLVVTNWYVADAFAAHQAKLVSASAGVKGEAWDLGSEQRLRGSGKIIGMGCSLTFLLVRRLLGLLGLGPAPQKDVEITVPRHQLAPGANRSLHQLGHGGHVGSASQRF